MTSLRPHRSVLVQASWLKDHVGDPNVRVVDIRWYLQGRRGIDAYNQGHLPGAVFVDLETDITAPAGPGRHPIPSAEQFAQVMARMGVSRGTRVVAYDDAGGAIAARLWWLCELMGHLNVRVLDGGLPAWVASGGTLTAELPTVTASSYPLPTVNRGRFVDRWFVDHARSRENVVLLDARAPERFRGETEPVDRRAGHIPGALNAPFVANLHEGRWKSPEVLRAMYSALGVRSGHTVICYCGSGVTACHDILALRMAMPGVNVLLYEGSWSDWAKDTFRPCATGQGV